MSAEENKALMRRVYEALNVGDMDMVYGFYDNSVISHVSHLSPERGLEGLKRSFDMLQAAFSNTRFTVEDQIAEGDKVVDHITFSGTHTGALPGIPPTSKRVTVEGIVIHRIIRGKIVGKIRGILDDLSMLQQLGVIPPPPQASQNLQALCYTCNAQKRDRDQNDFRRWNQSYEKRNKDCPRFELTSQD